MKLIFAGILAGLMATTAAKAEDMVFTSWGGTTQEAQTKSWAEPFTAASGVFTTNLARAHRMARGIHAGVVWVNTYRAVSPLVPFGGYGLSGLGREGGLDAIRDYTRSKSVWIRTSDEPIPDPFVMR